MTRLLLAVGFLVSVIVPAGAVAMVVADSGSDSDPVTIQMPVEPSTGGAPKAKTPGSHAVISSQPATESFDVFDGEAVSVDQSCAEAQGLEGLKADAVAAAKGLAPLKQLALDTEARLTTFNDRHPEQDLAPADLKQYEQLRARYRHSVRVFNNQVDDYNRLIDDYNDTLKTCSS
jgi:hypothetical protein